MPKVCHIPHSVTPSQNMMSQLSLATVTAAILVLNERRSCSHSKGMCACKQSIELLCDAIAFKEKDGVLLISFLSYTPSRYKMKSYESIQTGYRSYALVGLSHSLT